ncbi:hypothetical protein KEM54_001324, partial [Ascosphaera aggregata]
MSLEAALDEERRAILEILEGNSTKQHPKPSHQNPSYRHYRNAITGEPLTDVPLITTSAAPGSGGSGLPRPSTTSPIHSRSNSLRRHASHSPGRQPPVVRSMLDISSAPPPSTSSASSAAATVASTPMAAPAPVRPQGQVIRSMLDPNAPAPPPAPIPPRSHSRPGTPNRHGSSLTLSAFDINRRASDSATRSLPDFRKSIAAPAGHVADLPPNIGRDINGGYFDLDSGLPIRSPSLSPALPGLEKPSRSNEPPMPT